MVNYCSYVIFWQYLEERNANVAPHFKLLPILPASLFKNIGLYNTYIVT